MRNQGKGFLRSPRKAWDSREIRGDLQVSTALSANQEWKATQGGGCRRPDTLSLGLAEGCLKTQIHPQANKECCIFKNTSECVYEVSHHIHTHVKESDLSKKSQDVSWEMKSGVHFPMSFCVFSRFSHVPQ